MDTTEPPPSCHACGHQPWGDDRFCARCGESLSPDASGIPELQQFDLSDDDSLAAAEPTRGNRWETLVGLGILAVIVGVFAFIILAGDDDESESVADESDTELADTELADTELADTEPSVEPETVADPANTPTPDPTPRPTSTPTASAVSSSEGEASGDEAPLTLSLSELIETYDLGVGWLTFLTGDGPTAVNLESGERLVLAEASEAAGASSVFLGSDGVWFEFRSTWMFVSWDGSTQSEVSFDSSEDFEFIALVDDPEVGAILYGATGIEDPNPGAIPQIQAHSLALDERRTVEVDELLTVNSRIANEIFVALLFNGARNPMVTITGESYQWEWSAGWVQRSDGEVLSSNPTGQAVELRCTSPTNCTGVVTDEGELLGAGVDALPGFSVFGIGSPPILSPSGLQVASTRARSVEVSDLTSGESVAFPTTYSTGDIPTITWSANGSGLFLLGSQTGYIDLASGQVIVLDERLGRASRGPQFGGSNLSSFDPLKIFAELDLG